MICSREADKAASRVEIDVNLDLALHSLSKVQLIAGSGNTWDSANFLLMTSNGSPFRDFAGAAEQTSPRAQSPCPRIT